MCPCDDPLSKTFNQCAILCLLGPPAMAVLHEVSIPPHNAGPFFLATCCYPSQNSGACIAIQLSCWVFALAANRKAACSVFPPHSVTFSCARPPACAMAAVPKSRSMAVLRLMSDLKALNSEPPAVRGKAGKPVCLLRRQHMAPLTSTHTRSSHTAWLLGFRRAVAPPLSQTITCSNGMQRSLGPRRARGKVGSRAQCCGDWGALLIFCASRRHVLAEAGFPTKLPRWSPESAVYMRDVPPKWWVLPCVLLASVVSILTRFLLPLCAKVYADGTLCLDIIQDHWKPIYTVGMILTSIQVCMCGVGALAQPR